MRYCLLTMVLLANACFSRILQVPSQYATLEGACLSSVSGDTVLLAPGNYSTTARVNTSILIASNWIFERDTSFIPRTSLKPLDSMIFVTTTCSLSVQGVTLQNDGRIGPNRGILSGSRTIFQMKNCNVFGGFDTSRNQRTPLIYSLYYCDLHIDSVRYIEFPGFKSRLFQSVNSPIKMKNSSFTGRDFPYIDSPFIYANGAHTRIENCVFRMNSTIIDCGDDAIIQNSRFIGTYCWSLIVGGINHRVTTIENCVFDSCHMGEDRSLIMTGGNDSLVLYKNTIFRNINTNFGNAIFWANTPTKLQNVIFENISGFEAIIRGDRIFVDSTRFPTCQFPIFVTNSINTHILNVTNSDFGPTGQYASSTFSSTPFDTSNATNCYWGDPSGPYHPLNMNGQGMMLPNWVNPIPFRTQPVTAVRESPITLSLPSHYALSAYPNPFNSIVTLLIANPISTSSTLTITDLAGRIVQRQTLTPNTQSVQWQPGTVASGTYFCSISTRNQRSQTIPVIYLR